MLYFLYLTPLQYSFSKTDDHSASDLHCFLLFHIPPQNFSVSSLVGTLTTLVFPSALNFLYTAFGLVLNCLFIVSLSLTAFLFLSFLVNTLSFCFRVVSVFSRFSFVVLPYHFLSFLSGCSFGVGYISPPFYIVKLNQQKQVVSWSSQSFFQAVSAILVYLFFSNILRFV